jgi:FKBP-type peptidyl-prolyl cis-trans isomerase (trigger factor)
MVPDEFDTFINGILDDKKLPGLDDEVRAQLVRDLRQRLLDQINRAVIEALPEDKLVELDAAMDNPDVSEDQVQRLIVDSQIDVKRITAETMLRFRDLYLGSMGK